MTSTKEIVLTKQSRRGFAVAKGFEDKDINLPKRGTTSAAGYDFEAAETIVIPSYKDILETYSKLIHASILEKFTGQPNLMTEVSAYQYIENLDSAEKTEIGIKTIDSISEILEAVSSDADILEVLADPTSAFIDALKIGGDVNENILNGLFSKEKIEEIKSVKKLLKPVLVPTGIKAYMQENEFLGIYNRSSNPMKKSLVLTNGVGVIDADYFENESNDGHIMGQFINFSPDPIIIEKGDRIFQGIFQPFLLADDDVAGGKRVGGHGSTGTK